MASSPGSISAGCAHVRQLLRDTIAQLEPKGGLNDPPQSMILARDVTDALDRFSLWAGNLGAFLPSTSRLSLDQRLANAPETSERICEVLDDLGEAVSDLLELFSKTHERSTGVGNDGDLGLEDAEPANHTLGQEFEPGVLAETVHDSTEQLDEARSLLDCMSEYLRSLFRIAVMVRNAGPRDRFRHALQASNTTFTDIIDISHLREKHPKLSEDLRTLLGRANAKRRQFLKYTRDHSLRLAVERDESHPAQTELLSSKATTFAQPSFDTVVEDDSLSLISASTVSGENQVLSLPRLAGLSPDGAPFECPLCRTFQSFEQEGAWQKHAFRDLKAYTCTAGCDSMFGDRSAWFEHELRTHRTRYTCRLCSLPGSLSEGQLKAHISSAHGRFPEGHMQELLDSSREPVARFIAQDCPFCDEWALKLQTRQDPKGKCAENRDGDIAVSASRFRRHVAAHHEQLAIFAVPRERDDGSNPGTPNSRSIETASDAQSEVFFDARSKTQSLPGDEVLVSLLSDGRHPDIVASVSKRALPSSTSQSITSTSDVGIPAANKRGPLEPGSLHESQIIPAPPPGFPYKSDLDALFFGSPESPLSAGEEGPSDRDLVLPAQGGKLDIDMDDLTVEDEPMVANPQRAGDRTGLLRKPSESPPSPERPADVAETAASPRVSSRTENLVTGYWSPLEARGFSALLRTFGTDWSAIASEMGTKTPVMVESYFQRYKDDGKPTWEEIAKEADLRKRDQEQPPTPTPLAGSRRGKRESSPVDNHNEAGHPGGAQGMVKRTWSRTVALLAGLSERSVGGSDEGMTTATEASQGVPSDKPAPVPKATRIVSSGAATTSKVGKSQYFRVWYCCQCRNGPWNVMIVESCPTCARHHRCAACATQTLETYDL